MCGEAGGECPVSSQTGNHQEGKSRSPGAKYSGKAVALVRQSCPEVLGTETANYSLCDISSLTGTI